MSPEHRPAFILDDVDGADWRQVCAQKPADTPVMVLKNVKDLSIFHTEGIKDMHIDQAATKTFWFLTQLQTTDNSALGCRKCMFTAAFFYSEELQD